MAQLRQEYELFKEKDAEVVAIGPEKQEAFAKYWKEHEMPFPGIPDPTHRVADLFQQQVKLLKLGRMPAQVVIDKEGIIRHVHYGTSMKDIPDSREILKILEGC